MLYEEEEEEEDDAVEELLAGHIPLLVCRDADGKDHHENRAADECDSCEDAEGEGEAQDGFDERDSVAEAESEAVWKGRFRQVLGGGCGERAYAVVDADEAVTCEVDAEGDTEECIGEGFVSDSHPCLRRSEGEPSYIL